MQHTILNNLCPIIRVHSRPGFFDRVDPKCMKGVALSCHETLVRIESAPWGLHIEMWINCMSYIDDVIPINLQTMPACFKYIR